MTDEQPGTAPRCPDCGTTPGHAHHEHCDVARCLVTGGQRLTCFADHNHGADVWTGEWPAAGKAGMA